MGPKEEEKKIRLGSCFVPCPQCFLLYSEVRGSAGYKHWLGVYLWASNPVPDEEGTDGASRASGGRFSPLEKKEMVYPDGGVKAEGILVVFQWEDNIFPHLIGNSF